MSGASWLSDQSTLGTTGGHLRPKVNHILTVRRNCLLVFALLPSDSNSSGTGERPREPRVNGMANVRLNPQSSSSPRNYGRPTPDAPRKGVHHPASEEGQSRDDEDDYDAENGDLRQHPSSYVHNDNRVVTTNINSNNVNTENVVDSYNDNSTRTDIRKGSESGTYTCFVLAIIHRRPSSAMRDWSISFNTKFCFFLNRNNCLTIMYIPLTT
jgi:hypothetical protein